MQDDIRYQISKLSEDALSHDLTINLHIVVEYVKSFVFQLLSRWYMQTPEMLESLRFSLNNNDDHYI